MTVQGVTANSAAPSTTPASGNGTQAGNLDSTFLNLLITELKSQDPTAPMDATQMVGQMVSLNQLDQLIGIHQLLQTSLLGTTTAGNSSAAKGAN